MYDEYFHQLITQLLVKNVRIMVRPTNDTKDAQEHPNLLYNGSMIFQIKQHMVTIFLLANTLIL